MKKDFLITIILKLNLHYNKQSNLSNIKIYENPFTIAPHLLIIFGPSIDPIWVKNICS